MLNRTAVKYCIILVTVVFSLAAEALTCNVCNQELSSDGSVCYSELCLFLRALSLEGYEEQPPAVNEGVTRTYSESNLTKSAEATNREENLVQTSFLNLHETESLSFQPDFGRQLHGEQTESSIDIGAQEPGGFQRSDESDEPPSTNLVSCDIPERIPSATTDVVVEPSNENQPESTLDQPRNYRDIVSYLRIPAQIELFLQNTSRHGLWDGLNTLSGHYFVIVFVFLTKKI